jgi:hypothetical protein
VIGALGLALSAAPTSAAVSWAQEDSAPMDHAALATSYQNEARDAQQKAAMHETMMRRYQNAPSLPKGQAFPKEAMTQHCQKLITAYKQAAGEAGDLAKMHQEAAAQK